MHGGTGCDGQPRLDNLSYLAILEFFLWFIRISFRILEKLRIFSEDFDMSISDTHKDVGDRFRALGDFQALCH